MDLRLDLKEYDKASHTLNLFGNAYHRTGDVEKSLEYDLRALSIARGSDDAGGIALA